MKRFTLLVVPHTHWDREWYAPFEVMRARLVRMMDRLLDVLEAHPEIPCFLLDGQTICVDDYLEVRPEQRPRLEKLVREGRLVVGPNYVLPDEFLIGLESHIRNLMLGIRSARQLGACMMVGYFPDAFGHIAHMPSILRGFGIDAAVIWRGVGPEVTTSEFRWTAPDGSQVLALYLPYGYALAVDLPQEPHHLKERLSYIWRQLAPLATTPIVLAPNGNDHRGIQEDIGQVVQVANQVLEEGEVAIGHYGQAAEAIIAALGEKIMSLPLVEGEFRSSRWSHVLPGVLSSRIWIKQRYQECEDLLVRWAEPMLVWAQLLSSVSSCTFSTERALLAYAWKLLLQNAPHDSVCGCSVDEVHEEMKVRFQRCEQVAGYVLGRALREVAEAASPQDGVHLVVFNSEGGPRTDVVVASVPTHRGELPTSAWDAEKGVPVPLQLLSVNEAASQATVALLAPSVPGYGLRAFRLAYGDYPRPSAKSDRTIENEFFLVEASPEDGTLFITHKATGHRWTGLNRFVDGGDWGDEYNYAPPRDDLMVDSPSAPPTIEVVEAGPVRWALQVSMVYSLPASSHQERRSEERVDCPLVSRIYLYPNVPRIDIETEVDNRAQDHRLRVHFPTGLKAQEVLVDQHLGVIRRPVELPPPWPTDMEAPIATQPQKAFCAVEENRLGLLVANCGLPEYEAIREKDGTITLALTLLRCVGWLSRPNLYPWRRGPAGPTLATPGAQMLGRWAFRYSIIPYSGSLEEAIPLAFAFLRPMRGVTVREGRGKLPQAFSLLEVTPSQVVVSAIKLSEEGDGVVVRLYNPTFRPLWAHVRLFGHRGQVEEVSLGEEYLGPTLADKGELEAIVRPNEVRSFKFRR